MPLARLARPIRPILRFIRVGNRMVPVAVKANHYDTFVHDTFVDVTRHPLPMRWEDDTPVYTGSANICENPY